MCHTTVTIVNQLGLHVRACSKIVACANRFSAILEIEYKDKKADAKRIIEVMELGASVNEEVLITAKGEDASIALASLIKLFSSGFGEK